MTGKQSNNGLELLEVRMPTERHVTVGSGSRVHPRARNPPIEIKVGKHALPLKFLDNLDKKAIMGLEAQDQYEEVIGNILLKDLQRKRMKKTNAVPSKLDKILLPNPPALKIKKGIPKEQESQFRNRARIPKGVSGTMQMPVAVGNVFSNTQRAVVRNMGRGIRIVNREPIGSMSTLGSGSFSTAWLDPNPGDTKSFQWLSKEALGYERYKWHSLRLVFVPECTTTTAGVIAVTTDYDPNDTAPTSITNGLQNENSMQLAPWTPARSPDFITPDLKRADYRLIYHGDMSKADTNTIGTSDYVLYNFLSLFLCQGGGTNTVVAGVFWAEYDVELVDRAQAPDSTGATLIDGGAADSSTALLGSTGGIRFSEHDPPSPATSRDFALNAAQWQKRITSVPLPYRGTGAAPKINFDKPFEGYLLFNLSQGTVTGEGSSQQFGITLENTTNGDLTQYICGFVGTSGTGTKTEIYAVRLSAGQVVDFSISGITYTGSVMRLLLLPMGAGSMSALQSYPIVS
jgi:hypothetical protein